MKSHPVKYVLAIGVCVLAQLCKNLGKIRLSPDFCAFAVDDVLIRSVRIHGLASLLSFCISFCYLIAYLAAHVWQKGVSRCPACQE